MDNISVNIERKYINVTIDRTVLVTLGVQTLNQILRNENQHFSGLGSYNKATDTITFGNVLADNLYTKQNIESFDRFGITSQDISTRNDSSLLAHSHDNKSILDGIDSSSILNRDEAHSLSHAHTNKVLLDSLISNGDGTKYLANDGTYKLVGPFMVYPGAGIAVSTGSSRGTSITDNSTNRNTAYGRGNHASVGYALFTDIPTELSQLSDDSTHRLVTDIEKSSRNAKQDALGFTPENSANKNQNNGYAGLDSGGKVLLSLLPSTLLKYVGVWNASTNTPTLTANDTTKKGYVYNVGTAGVQFGISWSLGDWAIYNDNGDIEKSDNSDDVVSVNSQTGTVVLKTDDISDTGQTNKYVTSTQKTNRDTAYGRGNHADAGYLKLDQSTPQTIINGSPIFNVGIQTPKLFPNVDSTTAIQINKADGTTSVLNVDTTNSRVGIGTTSPSNILTAGFSNTGTTQSTSAVLNIFNSNSTANNMANIAFGQSGTSSNGFSRLGVIYTDRTGGSEDQDMFFGTIGGGAYGERMRITSTGNVGIGTASPAALLDVSKLTGSATISPSTIRISTQTSASDWDILNPWGQLEFYSADITGAGARVQAKIGTTAYSATGAHSRLGFFVDNGGVLSEAMGITHLGNVGIGTTTPAGRLDVRGVSIPGATLTAGDLVVDTDNRIVSIGRLSNASGDNTNFLFRDRIGGVKSYWENASHGSIGFGNFGDGFGIKIKTGAWIGSSIGSIGSLLYVDSTGNTNPTAIFMGGNVGIGTTSPGAKLDVKGDALTSYIKFAGSGTGDIKIGTTGGTGQYGAIWFNQSSPSTANYAFLGGGGFTVFNAPSGQDMSFTIGNAIPAKMTLRSDGNFGIGTTAPSQKLDVRRTYNGAVSYNLYLANEGTGNGTGVGIEMAVMNSTPALRDQALISSAWIDNTAGSEDSYLAFSTRLAGSIGEKLRIDNLGNVGIGTTSPTAKLSVAEKGAINEIGGHMIKLTNKTGSNSVKGTVVYASTGTDNAFNINPIDGDMPIGVVYTDGIADGAECWVVVAGIAEVLLVDTVATTRSYVAYSSNTTAGRIDTSATIPSNTTHFREIGHTLESKTGGTNVLVKCVLHFN